MSEHPFFKPPRFTLPSLNRVRLLSLSGMPVPSSVVGLSGMELVGAAALAARIRAGAGPLGLDPATQDLPRALNDCFEAPDESARLEAQAIAEWYGRRLGWLLLLIRQADPANFASRPDWDESHWAWWSAVERIWLGGGLVAGQLGQAVVAIVRDMLDSAGANDLMVELAPRPGELALLGLARLADSRTRARLVMDFGHSTIKRGIAVYENGAVVRLITWSPRPSPCRAAGPAWADRLAAATMLDAMTGVVAASWEEALAAGWPLSPGLGIALATHLHAGRPWPGERGCYAGLSQVEPDLQESWAAQITAAVDRPVHLNLQNDAAAAAVIAAGCRRCAVLTLGTAIGTGLPPPAAAGLRPLRLT